MTWFKIFSIIFLSQFIRYLIFAGGAYAYFWKFKKDKNEPRKLQKQPFTTKDIWREIRYSFLTSLIFGAILSVPFSEEIRPFTKVYTSASQYGYVWLVASYFMLLLMHDTYFYWMHRTLHKPQLFKVFHRVHHESKNPTPFAAFSFHPLEALAELGWILPVFFIIPLSIYAIIGFALTSLLMNVIGHLGVETYPERWKQHPILKNLNRSSYHNHHHAQFKGNYGLYFTWWDRWQKTLVDT